MKVSKAGKKIAHAWPSSSPAMVKRHDVHVLIAHELVHDGRRPRWVARLTAIGDDDNHAAIDASSPEELDRLVAKAVDVFAMSVSLRRARR